MTIAIICILAFVAAGGIGLAAYAMRLASDSQRQTVNTLDELLRATNDRCLNISDAHLQAKRDEREIPLPRHIPLKAVPDRMVTNWNSVDAGPGGDDET